MKNEIDAFLKNKKINKIEKVGFEEISKNWSGKGIVFLSGGVVYLSNAYMNIRFIREVLKSNIPIEIWYLNEKEKVNRLFGAIKSMGNVDFISVEDTKKIFPMKKGNLKRIMHASCLATMEGWRSKPYIIIHSKFKEIIYLDSDCFLFKSPEDIFNFEEYKNTKAVFSADIDCKFKKSGRLVDPKTFIIPRLGTFHKGKWNYKDANPLWGMLGIKEDNLPEFESGFMVLDKCEHVQGLFSTLFLNDNSDITYQYLYGDKDTFHLGWAKSNSSCFVLKSVERNKSSDHIVGKYNNEVLFEHRVFNTKFNPNISWNSFPNNNCFERKEIFQTYFNDLVKILKFKFKIF